MHFHKFMLNLFACLYLGLTSQTTIFQSCRDGANVCTKIVLVLRQKCIPDRHTKGYACLVAVNT